MKKIITLISVLVSLTSFGQTKTVIIQKDKFGTIQSSYQKSINIENKDTTYFVYLTFQNARYSTIVDVSLIQFTEQSTIKEFISDIKSVIAEGEKDKKAQINYQRDNYTVQKFDFTKNVVIGESKKRGSGYTGINIKQATSLMEWLDKINFGKE